MRIRPYEIVHLHHASSLIGSNTYLGAMYSGPDEVRPRRDRRLYDARGARIQICNRDILERGGRLLRRMRTQLRELCSLGHDLRASSGPESSGYTGGPYL